MPLLSRVRLEFCQTLSDTMDRSPQAPVSVGFSRQEYWSGLPYSPPGDPPDQGLNPHLLSLLRGQAGSLPLAPTEKAYVPL